MGNDETIRIQSFVERNLLKSSLKKGIWSAGLGAVGLTLAGTFLPFSLLKIFGFPIFFVGILAIGLGLLPYRKLNRLILKPHEFAFQGNYYLFLQEGKPLFEVPKESVDQMYYLTKGSLYGIAIVLKRPLIQKVKVFQRPFRFESFISDSRERFQCDLFLPYFTESAFKALLESDHAS